MMRSRNRNVVALVAAVVIVVVVVGALRFAGVLPGGPRPQPTPSSYTIQMLRPGEEQLLHSYGWIDQKAGIARIPVDRAIDIIAARGLPSRPAGASPPPDDQTIPSYPSSGTHNEPWLH